jgi:hypothetical protein
MTESDLCQQRMTPGMASALFGWKQSHADADDVVDVDLSDVAGILTEQVAFESMGQSYTCNCGFGFSVCDKMFPRSQLELIDHLQFHEQAGSEQHWQEWGESILDHSPQEANRALKTLHLWTRCPGLFKFGESDWILLQLSRAVSCWSSRFHRLRPCEAMCANLWGDLMERYQQPTEAWCEFRVEYQAMAYWSACTGESLSRWLNCQIVGTQHLLIGSLEVQCDSDSSSASEYSSYSSESSDGAHGVQTTYREDYYSDD